MYAYFHVVFIIDKIFPENNDLSVECGYIFQSYSCYLSDIALIRCSLKVGNEAEHQIPRTSSHGLTCSCPLYINRSFFHM